MKILNNHQISPASTSPTKSASASIYIVIFTTILLSVISLSFLRIVLSETAQTTDNELSQSAYDSAKAGIEDAKIALLKYHDCLNRGYTAKEASTKDPTTLAECEHIVLNMEKFIASESCGTIAQVLKRPIKDGHVVLDSFGKIDSTTQDANSAILDQAYACVKIKTNANNYIAYLDGENRSRIVPLRPIPVPGSAPVQPRSLLLQWHSASRLDTKSNNLLKKNMQLHGNGLQPKPANIQEYFRPPMLKFQLIQTDKTFHLTDMIVNNSGTGTDHATIFLKPRQNSPDNSNTIESKDLIASASKQSKNEIIPVKCSTDQTTLTANQPFMCKAIIKLPNTFQGNTERSEGGSLVRISLPYADPSTDFSLSLCTKDDGTECDKSDFAGVQAVVDSTGRAANFYRRIEARIELIDASFPYPDYAIQAPDAEIKKNFYITRNCWTEKAECANYVEDAP